MIRLSDRHYPYTRRELQADNPRASIPRELTPAQAAALGAAPVTKVARPEPDPGMRVVEIAPALVDDVWTQQWSQVPAEPEPVPSQVWGHQLRSVMRTREYAPGRTLWDEALARIAQFPEPQRTILDDSVRTAAIIRIDSPAFVGLGQMMGLDADYRAGLLIEADGVRI